MADQSRKPSRQNGGSFDMNAMLQAFATIQQQQNDAQLAGQREFLRAPNVRLDRYGGRAGENANPFDNGFFRSADERRDIETSRLGTPGFSSLSPGQQTGALMTNMPQDRVAGATAAGGGLYRPPTGVFTGVPTPLTSPEGTPTTDAANLAQAFAMYAPGGMTRPVQPFTPARPPARQPVRSSGASPRPGFNFSM